MTVQIVWLTNVLSHNYCLDIPSSGMVSSEKKLAVVSYFTPWWCNLERLLCTMDFQVLQASLWYIGGLHELIAIQTWLAELAVQSASLLLSVRMDTRMVSFTLF
ncbi:hypothetical protein FRX31_030395 [Thalictrum thalictroides]|uniref:Uncharacterized protein n=1 Tax=Thalictrum thalictroides TaxID=46969 RepID=A0A7J6V5Q4_THATH|nr:hypothetical protein FRX31_030395 [Thalictrum thalictroides]